MEVSLFDPSTVYYGSQYVHRSHDGGVHWEKISPDLTANRRAVQGGSGEPITRDVTGEEFYSTLYAISESKLEPGVIWTGSNDGPFYVTRDNGKTWKNITPKDLPDGRARAVHRDVAAPQRLGVLRGVSLPARRLPAVHLQDGRLRRDVEATHGWQERHSRRLADARRARGSGREGLLYAGTEFGMFISFDNGAHWQHFHLNMPNVPITDIKVHQNDLVVATQGRSMWIMDDITPLQQIGRADGGERRCAVQAARCDPRAGRRRTWVRWRRRWRWRAPGQAQFPPHGAPINYYLGSAPSGPVTIEIQDAAGKSCGASRARRRAAGAVSTAAAADARRRGGGGRSGGRAAGASHDERRNESADVGLQQRRRVHGAAGQLQGEDDDGHLERHAADHAQESIRGSSRLQSRRPISRSSMSTTSRMRDMVAEVGRVANRVRQARTRLRSGGNRRFARQGRSAGRHVVRRWTKGCATGARAADADHVSRRHDDARGSADRP